MSIYMRFENGKQVETTTLPEGEGWCELPENLDQNKSYKLTEEGEIVERTEEDIEEELLNNAKLCALNDMRFHFNNNISSYTGHSLQKAKSYEIQAKAAESILASSEPNMKDVEIIEPLANVRGITVIEMAKIIQEKAEKAVKVIAKCEELEDLAKKRIKEAKNQTELQTFLNNFEKQIKDTLGNL